MAAGPGGGAGSAGGFLAAEEREAAEVTCRRGCGSRRPSRGTTGRSVVRTRLGSEVRALSLPPISLPYCIMHLHATRFFF